MSEQRITLTDDGSPATRYVLDYHVLQVGGGLMPTAVFSVAQVFIDVFDTEVEQTDDGLLQRAARTVCSKSKSAIAAEEVFEADFPYPELGTPLRQHVLSYAQLHICLVCHITKRDLPRRQHIAMSLGQYGALSEGASKYQWLNALLSAKNKPQYLIALGIHLRAPEEHFLRGHLLRHLIQWTSAEDDPSEDESDTMSILQLLAGGPGTRAELKHRLRIAFEVVSVIFSPAIPTELPEAPTSVAEAAAFCADDFGASRAVSEGLVRMLQFCSKAHFVALLQHPDTQELINALSVEDRRATWGSIVGEATLLIRLMFGISATRALLVRQLYAGVEKLLVRSLALIT